MKTTLNYWALVVSGIATTAFGFLWYMVLFRQPYVESLGRTQEQMDKGPSGPVASVMQLIGNTVMIYVLAWLMNSTGNTTISGGLKLAAMIWIGFIAAVIGPMYAFEAFPLQLFLINTGYTLICLTVGAIIIGAWR